MTVELLFPLAALALWSWGFYRLGRSVERRRAWKRSDDPPTVRQIHFLSRLATQLDVDPPEVRTVAEASAVIDDLLEEKRRRGDG